MCAGPSTLVRPLCSGVWLFLVLATSCRRDDSHSQESGDHEDKTAPVTIWSDRFEISGRSRLRPTHGGCDALYGAQEYEAQPRDGPGPRPQVSGPG